MNWTLRKSALMVRVNLRGTFNEMDFRRMFSAVAGEIDDLAFRPVLFDDRELNVTSMTLPDVIRVRELMLAHSRAFTGKKVALLMRSRAEFELAATFKKITQPLLPAAIEVFTIEGEALDWLKR